jgi:hypothetical protein
MGSELHHQHLYNRHVNQRLRPVRKIEYYSEGLIPYGAITVGCTTVSRLSPLRQRRHQFECDNQPYGMEHISLVI